MSELTVVITGGTGGLGTALASRLKARGARIAATYLIPEEAEAFEAQLELDEDRLLLRRVDATKSKQLDAFIAETVETFGGFNGLCCLVGGWAGGRDIDESDDVRFDRMIDLNLRSAFITLRAAIPHLKKQEWGRIVLVGSRAAIDNPPGQAAFNITKAAVAALAASAAAELAEYNITANAVLPSVIDTPATRATLPYADYVDWPTPADIATVIEYLCLKESGAISGAAIPAYGKA